MATLKQLQSAITEAVALLDEADGSRVGMSDAIDSARDILAEAYGPTFENDVNDAITALDAQDDADDDSEDDDQD
jgi:hypothetical protein